MQFNGVKIKILSRESLFVKQTILTVLVAMAIVLFTQTAFASALGTAGDYSVFVFEDFTASNYGDVQGRLAAGGNVTLSNYGVGDKLPGVTSLNTLVVGGNLSFTNGQVNNGSAVVGGTATVSGFGIPKGTLTQKTTVPINFAAEEIYLTNLSATLSTMTANGVVNVTVGGDLKNAISLKGDGTSSLQVFYIDASVLASASSFSISGIPDGTTVLINVSGSAASMKNFSLNALAAISDQVLFNFYQVETLALGDIAVEGSILAPFADITTGNGHINGTVITESWTGTMEVHYVPFEGTTPTPTPTPEPATLVLLFSGLIGLAGVRRRSKK